MVEPRSSRNTLPRCLMGYRPRAVRAALADLEALYQTQDVALSAHLWDLVRLVDWLKPVVEAVESVLAVVAPDTSPAPFEGEQSASAWKPTVSHPPASKPLRRSLIGYRAKAVRAAMNEVRQRWEIELLAHVEEATRLDSQRLALMVRLSRARQRLVQVKLQPPVAAPVRVHTVDNVVPLKTREVRVALQVQAVGSSHAALQAINAWRPGSVEETEAIESGAMPAPVAAATVKAAGTRSLAKIQLGRVDPLAQVAAAMMPEPARPAALALTGAEGQIQAGLTSRIEILFQRFLVGKAVGTDLVPSGGQVLASKGTLITRDLAHRAEEAGLLPMLIAHMTVPGVAAD